MTLLLHAHEAALDACIAALEACLAPDDIQTAIAYIEAHAEEVTTAYRQILARHRNVQYTPEVQAKLDRNRQKLQAKLAEIRARQQAESAHANDHGGSSYRRADAGAATPAHLS